MIVREHVPLATLTTLKVGGNARYVLTVSAPPDLPVALAFAREQSLPFVMLGQGSNVLPDDAGYAGVVILMRIPGIAYEMHDGYALVHVGAGVSWDELVRDVAAHELWGIENLAGIPGTVGAAPVQNIGAYGAEVHTVIEAVDAYDSATNEQGTFAEDACGFTYRDSRFKHEPNLIITSVTFRLRTDGAPQVEYPDLIKARAAGADLSSPSAIGKAVRDVRSAKFPDLARYGTAGSFFKNPFLTQHAYEALSEHYQAEAEPYGGIPLYPVPDHVKIPLAFILDKLLGLKGYRLGNAFLFGNQPLVLVADDGARATDVDTLARDIEERVATATGISIEREVRMLDAHEAR